MRSRSLLIAALFAISTAYAELEVKLLPLKTAGQKVIVPLEMKNNFSQDIESARAAVFLLDDKGNRLGQGTRWVIGGNADRPGLQAGVTNVFHFVVTADKPITSTNLTAQVLFSRIILSGGKLADVKKNVRIRE